MNISLENVRNSVIGEGVLIETAFGKKPMVYADYTASGRALSFVEKTIQEKVLPFYANTHSESSFSGKQSSRFREEARLIIKDAINASDKHKVIFTGSGATTAINKLIDMLNLRLPAELDTRYQFSQQIAVEDTPVVFIGPYEHHSNELPWRESIVELVRIPLNSEGHIDQQYLEEQLEIFQSRPLLIGSFSAASNVTGIKSNVNGISKLLKEYNALSCWDYAAAAPYVGIDVIKDSLDVVYISTHKFIGGPGTPGILVVNSDILNNSVPALPGGGTVVYVSPTEHTFSSEVERREEGGTPAIVESIRAGLVFQIQQLIGTSEIERLEHQYISSAIAKLSSLENFELLGSDTADRLSILSFNIKHKDKVLHYGFIVALLNDLFGIQARGGCSCAGPYGHELLALSTQDSAAIEEQLHKGHMVLRPGWTRLNFNYFIDQQTFDYLLNALTLITEHGWKMLPYYHFNPVNGTWQYQCRENDRKSEDQVLTVSLASLLENVPKELENTRLVQDKVITAHSDEYHKYFLEAQEILLACEPIETVESVTESVELSKEAEALRWFAVH